jgi:23S rRNA (guanosine2251-2'-O)-methyltransferase
MREYEWLYGRNAVRESLRAGRRTFRHLYISQQVRETDDLRAIESLARQHGLTVERVEPRVLEQHIRRGDQRNQRNQRDQRDQRDQRNHQGVIAEASTYPYGEIDDCLALAGQRREPPLLLLLDHVQDPQNVGTLLRTAEVVGVHGVVIPHRRAVGITPAVVNASSGATEHLTIVLVSNLDQTIRLLQREGVLVVGVEDDERASAFDTLAATDPLALVVGAEGPGLARLTRERCDMLVRLPMRGHLASLNVAVAGSIVLYQVWRQRERENTREHQQNSGKQEEEL